MNDVKILDFYSTAMPLTIEGELKRYVQEGYFIVCTYYTEKGNKVNFVLVKRS